MRKSLRLALLISSSLLFCILPLRQSEECAFEPDWEDFRMRFFEPGLDGMAGLSPFYYTKHLLYNGTDDPQRTDIQRNCREWQTYLGSDVALADIDQVLYGSENSDNFLNLLEDNQLSQAFPRNTFIKKLFEPRYEAALKYLAFVKRLEFAQHAEEDPWYEWSKNSRADTTFFNLDSQVDTFRQQSLAGLEANTSDPFLQKRYAYQAVVCHRYYGPDSVALAVFDRYFSPRDTTVLMPWALIHKADCLLRRGDSLQYNYLLSKVFDECASKKLRAVELFVSAWTEETVTYAPTPSEKAVVLTMKALQYPGRGLSLLQRIVDFDPHCRYLPLLISREINKLEDWTLSQKLTGYGDENLPDELYGDDGINAGTTFTQRVANWRQKNAAKDRLYLHEVREWLEKLTINKSLSEQQDFLHLAAAHLNFLDGNYSTVQSFLSKISPRAQPRLLLQRDIERLLLMPYTHDLHNATAQADLTRQLRHIESNRQYLDQPTVQLSRLNFYFSHALFRVGDIPAAGLFYNKAWLTNNEGGTMFSGYNRLEFFDAHATVTDLERLISLRKNGPRTAFERYLIETPGQPDPEELAVNENAYWWYSEKDSIPTPLPTLPDLLELQGTIAFRDGDLPHSKIIFEQLPSDFWKEENMVDVDIFADKAHFPFEEMPSFRGGKIKVVNQMLALEKQSQSATGVRLAEICYKLGNGWFNCSYWGRSWYMFSYNRSYQDDDSPEVRTAGNFPGTPDVRKYGSTYFRFDRALLWYHRALAAHPSKELAAKIEYMIADCDRYVRVMHDGNKYYAYDEEEKLPSSPLFRQWAARYKQTATFTERITHCPELRDYLER